jgi:hypothetical protein
LDSLSSSAGISGGQAFAILFISLNATRFQLDAVRFSEQILSYFSAFQFNFDGTRMVKDGYEKPLSLNSPFLDDVPTFRQDQVYLKLQILGPPSTISGRHQMMSCP